MIPWELIDSARVPGGGSISLHRRDTEYSIRVDGLELMNSRAHSSEEELARLACERLVDCSAASVLVGGLGMGYTAAAALKLMGQKARVVVAELSAEVVKWNRGPLSGLAGAPLSDRRVKVLLGDVAEIIASSCAEYDAILLDVDNGPEGLTRKDNDRLYGLEGMRAARRALRPGGVLAVWSAAPDRGFAKRLRQSGFEVREAEARSRGRRGGHHTIWVGVNSGRP